MFSIADGDADCKGKFSFRRLRAGQLKTGRREAFQEVSRRGMLKMEGKSDANSYITGIISTHTVFANKVEGSTSAYTRYEKPAGKILPETGTVA